MPQRKKQDPYNAQENQDLLPFHQLNTPALFFVNKHIYSLIYWIILTTEKGTVVYTYTGYSL